MPADTNAADGALTPARLAFITTGGTIAHVVRASDGVAELGYDVSQLLGGVDAATISLDVHQPFTKGSKDVTTADWSAIAGAVGDALAAGVDGIVVLHGTDTMHYSAAAVAFAVGSPGVPVVFTGSMAPGSQTDGDAVGNVAAAVAVATQADVGEVCVVFSGDAARSYRSIWRAVGVKKLHSFADDALRSPNMSPLGSVRDGVVVLDGHQRPRGTPAWSPQTNRFDDNVGLIKVHPSLRAETLAAYLEQHSGVVIEGTGIGHLHQDLYAVVEQWAKPVVICTQAPFGGEALGAYEGDAELVALPNVIRGGAMTSETAFVKLAWCLAGNADPYLAMPEELVGEFGGNLNTIEARS